jgi:hypothetical protein
MLFVHIVITIIKRKIKYVGTVNADWIKVFKMTEKIQPKIKYFDNRKQTDIMLGGYEIINNTIYLDKNLKKYPRLHDKVLNHELYHAKNKTNLLKHIYIDYKDFFIMFHSDFNKFYYNYKKEETKKESLLETFYNIHDFIRGILQLPFMCFIDISLLIYELFCLIKYKLKK